MTAPLHRDNGARPPNHRGTDTEPARRKLDTARLFAGPLALAIVLAIGASILWAKAAEWLPEPSRTPCPWNLLIVNQQGEPIIGTDRAGDGTLEEWSNWKGERVTEPSDEDRLWPDYWRSDPNPFEPRRDCMVFRDAFDPPRFWTLLRVGTHAYFAGYESATNQRVGYLSRAGFSEVTPPPRDMFHLRGPTLSRSVWSEQQEGDGQFQFWPLTVDRQGKSAAWVLIYSGQTLYRIDLMNLGVDVVLRDPEILSVEVNFPSGDVSRKCLSVWTRDRLFREPVNGGERISVPIPPEIRDRGFGWHTVPGGGYLITAEHDDDYDVYWLSETGEVLRHVLLDLLPLPLWEDSPRAFLAAPSPWQLTLPLYDSAKWYARKEKLSFADALAKAAWHARLSTAATIGLACTLALMGYVLERRRGQGRGEAAAWFCFIFLGGPAAFLGRWLVRQSRKDTFPLPAPIGIEVFA